jgi:hypothetical protein
MSSEKNARECFIQEEERDEEEAVKGLTGLAEKYYSSNILDIYFFHSHFCYQESSAPVFCRPSTSICIKVSTINSFSKKTFYFFKIF